jgi:dTDP-4-amino-4,6-dideoxygalactose transaminase
MSVVAVGAIPVIAEIDETLTIDPVDVEKKITPHTKAIMPVHMLGMPCKMDAICEIAEKHGIKVIEDACQAMGGDYKGKKLGTWGDAGAYSYNHFKIISAGEGGALVTNDKDLYQKALIYHDSSAVCFFGNQLEDVTVPPFCGNEYRTNEITSAILRQQLKKLDGIKKDLKKAKKYMAERLSAKYNVNYTNDFDGDLGMHIQIIASTEEEAKKIVEQGAGSILINSSRHVYSDWEAIMQKRGHLNPLMDPFKFEANRDIIPDYTHDMCPKSLDILSRAVSIPLSPDKTEAELDEVINKLLSVE